MNLQQIRKATIKLEENSKTVHTFEVGHTPTKTTEVMVRHWDSFAGRIRHKVTTVKTLMPVVKAITAYDMTKPDGKVAVRFANGTGRWFRGRQLSVTGKEKP